MTSSERLPLPAELASPPPGAPLLALLLAAAVLFGINLFTLRNAVVPNETRRLERTATTAAVAACVAAFAGLATSPALLTATLAAAGLPTRWTRLNPTLATTAAAAAAATGWYATDAPPLVVAHVTAVTAFGGTALVAAGLTWIRRNARPAAQALTWLQMIRPGTWLGVASIVTGIWAADDATPTPAKLSTAGAFTLLWLWAQGVVAPDVTGPDRAETATGRAWLTAVAAAWCAAAAAVFGPWG